MAIGIFEKPGWCITMEEVKAYSDGKYICANAQNNIPTSNLPKLPSSITYPIDMNCLLGLLWFTYARD